MEIKCSKEKCTGCHACYSICPKNAISMLEDKNGFRYPKIDKEKCIECGLCNKVCPIENKVQFNFPLKAYAMWNKEAEIRRKSTSGGAAATFYKHIIDNNGVVYGVANLLDDEIKFIRVDNLKDLESLKGSKYVQANVNNIYLEVKKDLSDKKRVLFIGTPCQVAGLKKFLILDYKNLITIDLICHGVPSQKFLMEELKLKVEGKIDKISFRKEDEFLLEGKNKQNKIVYSKNINDSPYYFCFWHAISYRESCYSCEFAKPERCSDITIGDFWGLGEETKFNYSKKEGVSVLLPNTNKGIKFIEECSNLCFLEERNVTEAINGNSQLRKPSIIHKKHNAFFESVSKKGYIKSFNSVFKVHRLKQKIKKNKLIYKLIKKIKNI